jgi:hypothetical protein
MAATIWMFALLLISAFSSILWTSALAPKTITHVTRRTFMDGIVLLSSGPALAYNGADSGLAARLASRDPKQLQNKLFNLPPSVQVFPEWMAGDWTISSTFNGFIFPSTTISKQRIVNNSLIPGFQKCSIAATSDVGKDATYQFRIDPVTRQEDRPYNLKQSINAYLGYEAVSGVIMAVSNPNRISIDFVDYETINAERIELFCNARESQEFVRDSQPAFVHSEYIRQVTFGTGTTVGVPRQVVTNYAHFYTWQQTDTDHLRGNLLTAGFLDPLDGMYDDEQPTLPVVIYSHVLQAKRLPS